MVCKEEICNWFKHVYSWDRIDLLCKLLHLCSSHELRFIASIVEDQAKKDYNTLRDSATRANNVSELKKLCPDLFNAVDRSTLLVYLSLLQSNNTVCSHTLFSQLRQIETQRLASHLQSNPNCENENIGNLDPDVTDDIILLYTMAAYHPAFSISQRFQLCDYLHKAQAYLAEYRLKSEEANIRDVKSSTIHSATKIPVHVRKAQVIRSDCEDIGNWNKFSIEVVWSSGEITQIYRTYQQIHAFHVELLRLFPKDSGAHRQERHIPYLPQERKGQAAANMEHIDKYIRLVSSLPQHIIECDHVTGFFIMACAPNEESSLDTDNKLSPDNSLSLTSISDDDEVSGSLSTSHSVTGNVQHRINLNALGNPVSHKSHVDSSPLVSPAKMDVMTWLKLHRLHKYDNLRKYSWHQLARLDERDLEREGLTDGARNKFQKALAEQLQHLAHKNGMVKVGSDSTGSATTLSGTSPATPSVCHHSTIQHHPPVHLPLAVVTRTRCSLSTANSVCSTNSIGSCSPGLSDSSGFTPPTSPLVYSNNISAHLHNSSHTTLPNRAAWTQSLPDPGVGEDESSELNAGTSLCISEMTPFHKAGEVGSGGVNSNPDSGNESNTSPGTCMQPLVRMPSPTEPVSIPAMHPMGVRGRAPLGMAPVRVPGSHYYGSSVYNVHTAPMHTLPTSANVLPESSYQGILMTKPGSQPPGEMSSCSSDANAKSVMHYPVLQPMIPRMPTLVGPLPGMHVIPQPGMAVVTSSSAGIPCPVTHGSTPMMDAIPPVHLPPTNIPPPITGSSQAMSVPFPSVACCSVTFTVGPAFQSTAPSLGTNQTSNGLLPTPPGVHTVMSAGSSATVTQSPPLSYPTPSHTPTTTSTPVPFAHSTLNSECTCRCKCPQCTSHSQPAQHVPHNPHPITYQPQIGWTQGPMVTGAYPISAGMIPVSSNGLVNHALNFPPFSQHMAQAPYPSEMMFEFRNHPLMQGGVPRPFHPQLHYPTLHGNHIGLQHFVNNGKPLKLEMCYNCGQSGHQAHDCNVQTMENATRARFHLNMQPWVENG